MVTIRITPERVREVAREFSQASSQSQDMVTRLQSTISNIEGDWEGMTKNRFFSEFQQWQTSMRSFVELLNGIGQQLEEIAVRFEQTDQG